MDIGSAAKAATHFLLKAEESAWEKKYGVQRPLAVTFLDTSEREGLGFNQCRICEGTAQTYRCKLHLQLKWHKVCVGSVPASRVEEPSVVYQS